MSRSYNAPSPRRSRPRRTPGDADPWLAPSLDDLARLAEAALADLPAALRSPVTGVALVVEDFPDDGVCAEMELESPFDLMGLYAGVPFGEKESFGTPQDVDRIFLYRRPILDYWCESGEDLDHLVRHVLLHEIGHHYGFSDDDMERLEAEVG